METNFLANEECRNRIATGIEMVASAVGATMGPHGRLSLIDTSDGIHATKDGVTVANSILSDDPFINIGIRMMRDAANKTAKEAGDGTSNTCVMANALIQEGLKALKEGISPVDLVEGIRVARASTMHLINKANAVIKEDDFASIYNIAKVASNGNEEMADIITEVLKKTGAKGTINIAESTDHNTFSKTEEGVVTGFTLLDRAFTNNKNNDKAILENCYVYITKGTAANNSSIQEIITAAYKDGKSLVIIAEAFDPKLVAICTKNNANGTLRCALVKINSWGKQRDDLVSDLRSVLENEGIHKINNMEVYAAQKVISDIYKTSFTVQDRSGCSALLESIKDRMLSADVQEKAMLQERYKILSGGMATIFVGANTKSELLEKKDRYEDAIEAVKSAIEEGILPGGGVFHMHAVRNLEKEKHSIMDYCIPGYNLFMKALLSPLHTNINNLSSKYFEIDLDKYTDNEGYNLATFEFGNMDEMGIIDATKVTRIAITNAVSIATTILMTATAIK